MMCGQTLDTDSEDRASENEVEEKKEKTEDDQSFGHSKYNQLAGSKVINQHGRVREQI